MTQPVSFRSFFFQMCQKSLVDVIPSICTFLNGADAFHFKDSCEKNKCRMLGTQLGPLLPITVNDRRFSGRCGAVGSEVRCPAAGVALPHCGPRALTQPLKCRSSVFLSVYILGHRASPAPCCEDEACLL